MASLDFNLSVAACPLIQVEGWDGTLGQFETSLSASLGTKLPASVGETVRHKGFLVIRVAPRRLWLALDDGAQAPSLAVDPDLGCSVSLGEGRVRFRMTGADVARVLSRCIAVDWRAPAAATGRAVLTSLHHVPVLFLRTSETACELIVPRGFSRSLSDWIAGWDC
ncbi:MAG: sarcosine oxidase subunit gamma [Mesorhizobium sp.]|uniref:sarcosine oxidase subunit gamma n=1 Tax=Mesorhizobium sp. TaxID=1871066 RepID=UPI000FE997A0|nr:sarcosine oxidase subunit gamma [Mesorhizobium sp.]RWB31714.1 MAG: sarcosine oxidase subunit gamma [Mesorhizobium sp.]RWB50684.1 MAG: sarcosine oxidase subunit gamma [Mesorhizobium sp.]RWD09566.1 MAG: sarcosine oxidase subunit gamma [Mesorhizobium sp.]RWE55303.1 MAG: sarcosine oxidase subunit gamma [Mesorhizobium sp.]TIU95981.1 MAG: sarcosine oxidase subunit gamma [Mesorhizobium sp.]